MKVFKYGARPVNQESLIRDQMKLARNYYNKLVETENKRRQQAWGSEKPPPPPHPPEEVVLPDGSKKTKWCRCEECKTHWKTLREAYYALDNLDKKPLRAAASSWGLYWGSYLLVEQAFDQAQKTTVYYDPVRFRGWRKGGQAGLQIQNGKNTDSLFKVEEIPDPEPSARSKKNDRRAGKGKRRGQLRTLRIRIGTEGRTPIWSDPIIFKMHRPLEGTVCWLKICMFYRGDREIWSVNFTCKDTSPRTDSATDGVVAIDVSWRQLPNGDIRLAYARGDNGFEDELTLDNSWLERIKKAERIQSHRDERLNDLKTSDSRFRLFKSPRSARIHIMKNQIAELEDWAKREKHLEQYELGCKRKTYDVRRDAVRVWLRKLRRLYQTVVIKDSSHKEMKEQAKAKKKLHRAARKQGHHGAPGEIVEEICKVFGRIENVAVVIAENTTATCPVCGHMHEVNKERMITCERCGTTDDRDRISTHNLLSRFFDGQYEKPTARKTESKFAKKHKKVEQEVKHLRDGL